jgi:hypothetical protein
MRILLLLSIAGALCAQSPTSNASAPGSQSIVNSMLSPKPAVTLMPGRLPELKLLRAPATASARVFAERPPAPCSVPLLEMQIPAGVDFTMQTIKPPVDKIDRMQVIVPAPACPDPPK